MFRYERPQRGRYRQFTQFGVEALGPDNARADVESMELAWDTLRRLGLQDALELRVNTLGDAESRSLYTTHLTEFFGAHREALSDASKQRLDAGHVMRILDSKNKQDVELFEQGLPSMEDSLSSAAKERFEAVQTMLKAQDIPFTIDRQLVRGLDYYAHTVFEFVETPATIEKSNSKSQRPLAFLAGGRYTGLAEALGATKKPGTPGISGVGWAAGMERIVSLRDLLGMPWHSSGPRKILVVPVCEKGELAEEQNQVLGHAMQFAQHARKVGVSATFWDASFGLDKTPRNVIKQAFKAADTLGCTGISIIGSMEAKHSPFSASLKNTVTGSSIDGKDIHTFEDLQDALSKLELTPQD